MTEAEIARLIAIADEADAQEAAKAMGQQPIPFGNQTTNKLQQAAMARLNR